MFESVGLFNFQKTELFYLKWLIKITCFLLV